MADFNVRSEAVDVDEIMKQIRSRIREKRGVDYTEADLQHLAYMMMEQFVDPRKLRSELVEQFKRQRAASPEPHSQEGAAPPVETGNAFKRLARKIVRRIVRSAVNPQETVDVLNAEFRRREELYYEILHNLVLELTRQGIEVHNLRMQAESLSSRLDFDERRGRALESVVQYQRAPVTPGTPGPARPPVTATAPGGSGPVTSGQAAAPSAPTAPWTPPPALGPPGQARPDGERRRRRRRRRRRPGQTMGDRQGAPGAPGTPGTSGTQGGGAPDSGGDVDDAGDEGEGDGAADQ